MDEKMDEKVSRKLIAGFIVEEAGEEGGNMLIVRASKDEH